MISQRLSRRAFCLCAAVILLLSLAFGIYWGTQKKALFIDEAFSYMLANGRTDYGQHVSLAENTWTDSSAILETLSVTPGHGFDYGQVYLNQANDVHPPLFYYLLHTVSSLFPGQFSVWYGLGINLFFFAAGFVVLASILLQLTRENRLLTLVILLVYGLNYATLSNMMFIRMYMMLTFFVLTVTWLHLRVLQGKLSLPWFLALTALTCFLGFLTQYFFLIYIAFLCLLFSIRLWARKPYGSKSPAVFAAYASTLLVALGATYLAFPAWVEHIFSGSRGETALSSLAGEGLLSFANERDFFNITSDLLFSGWLPWLLLLLLLMGIALLAIRRMQKPIEDQPPGPEQEKKQPTGLLLVVGSTWLFLLAAAHMALPPNGASHVYFRFLSPAYPLLLFQMMIAFHALCHRLSKRRLLSLALTLALFGGMDVAGYLRTHGSGTNSISGEPLFIYSGEQKFLDFAWEHQDTPVVILYRNRLGYHSILTELMNYNQLYLTHAQLYQIGEEAVAAVEDCEELLVYLPYGDEDEASYLGYIYETFYWLYDMELQFDTIDDGRSVYLFTS